MILTLPVTMETYLTMLYVTVEQEQALRQFFAGRGWPYYKPDLSVTTDEVGCLMPTFSWSGDMIVASKSGSYQNKTGTSIPHSSQSKPGPKYSKKQFMEINHDIISEASNKSIEETGNMIVKQEGNDKDSDSTDDGDNLCGSVYNAGQTENYIEILEENKAHGEDSNRQIRKRSPTSSELEVPSSDDVPKPISARKRRKLRSETAAASGEDTEDLANVHPNRSKYRLYSPSALTSAYKCVKEEGMSVLKASRIFKVPESSLRDRTLGKVDPENVVMGSLPLFDQSEEMGIINHINMMFSNGNGYTRQECLDLATDYAIKLGKRDGDKPLSIKWLKGFLKRWPELVHKLVKSPRQGHINIKMSTETTAIEYFERLEKCLREHGLEDKPHLIFNVKEIELPIDQKLPYIVRSADISVQSSAPIKGKTITLFGCGSASGVSVPPFFVFPGKKINMDLLNVVSSGGIGTMSESGLSSTEVFRQYLQTHLMKFIPNRHEENILLLLDGQRSHCAVDLDDWAKSNNIILFFLPAQTNHLLQPLDVACYEPFERIFNTLCHNIIKECSVPFTRYKICDIACKVYSQALRIENLQAAFEKTGVYPLNKDAVAKEYIVPSKVHKIDRVVVEVGSEARVEVDMAAS